MVAENRHKPQCPDLPMSGTPKQDVDNDFTSGQIEVEIMDVLDVSDCAWFFWMVILIYGFALFLIGSCVYNFPASPINRINLLSTDDLEQPVGLVAVLEQYVILFSLCSVIVVVFASVCLAIRIKTLSPSPSNAHWRKLGSSLSPSIQDPLWISLIVFLIGGVMVFDWFIFDGTEALFYTNLYFPVVY